MCKYKPVLILIFSILIFNSCEKDIEGFMDERYLPGELAFYFDNINPDTGEKYTLEEIAEKKARLGSFAYNPAEEERYLPEQQVLLNFVLIKPIDKLTINNVTDVNNVVQLYSFNSAEQKGDLYTISIITTIEELGLSEEGDEIHTKWDFVYKDASIGSDIFTIAWAKPPPDPPEESDLPFLVGPLAHAVKGYWQFDEASDLTKATIGFPLELIGSDEAVEGVNSSDGATQVKVGSGYSVVHGLPASGGNQLNIYSLIYDVSVPAIGSYINLLQNSTDNSSDGNTYINPSGGMWHNGLGSEGSFFTADTWYRIVITLNVTEYKVYIDGSLIYSGSVSTDSYFAPQLSNFNVFLDDNGEDETINCSSLILLDEALSGAQIASLPPVTEPAYKNYANDVAGRWKFDDPDNLSKSTIGLDLELVGSDMFVEGVTAGDGATEVGVGSGYKVFHNMPAEGGNQVNVYSIIYDVSVPAIGSYINLLQNSVDNSSDGNTYINPSGGMWHNGLGSEGSFFTADTWYRVIITLDNTSYKAYIDGALVFSGSVSLDSYFAPQTSNFNVFLDDNGEDETIRCSDLIVLKSALTTEEITHLPPVDIPVY